MKTADIDVTYVGHYGDDLTVVNAARVSFNKGSTWDNQEEINSEGQWGEPVFTEGILKQSDVKLITYLAKHKHFSPFNHSFISVRVKAPIFVARQLQKHRFMPWNEVSRRYVDEEPEFYIPLVWRKRSESAKQGSSDEEVALKIARPWAYDGLINTPQEMTEECLKHYEELLKQGVCPEQARMVLPQNMMTEWIWSGTLGAFCDMLRLRLDPHTQYETRIVANKIHEIISPLFTVSVAALLEI